MISKTDTSEFPPVILDTTLYDLLRDDLPDGETELESLCFFKPNSDTSIGTVIPLSNKYILHSPQVVAAEDVAHMQLEICSELLMFFSGPMNTIFVAAEGETDDETLNKQTMDKNAKKSFSVIQESQRPIVKTYANVKDCIANHDGTKIRWGFGLDMAEKLPYLFHPDLTYNSTANAGSHKTPNSKAQTTKSSIVKSTVPPINPKDGTTAAKIKRALPFVVKQTQSLSALGTHMVKTQKERADLLDDVSEYLSDYLPRVTKENVHLHPTALILSDLLDGDTAALNFFVRRDGSVIFLGSCNQLGTGGEGQQFTAITYANQEKDEKKYRPVLDKIGAVLHEEGYYGAVGADIMEDSEGNLYTIDLNVRTPLSLLLYLLKGHFNEKRGFGMAVVYECILLRVSREDLEEKFRKEFEEGRFVIIGATKLGGKDVWPVGFMIAGEGKEQVDELNDRIMALKAPV